MSTAFDWGVDYLSRRHAETSSATICGCCGADRSKGQLHTFACANRCIGEVYAEEYADARSRVNAYGVADQDAALPVLKVNAAQLGELKLTPVPGVYHGVVDYGAGYIAEVKASERAAFQKFLADRATELRTAAARHNLFEGVKVELLRSAKELERAARDFAAIVATE